MTDSKLEELARRIDEWPGLVSGPAMALIEDSLVVLDHLGAGRTVVDVGSGGGLPGLALKISRPELQVTVIEADQAKAAFLVQTAARLSLRGVEVVPRRAEEAAHDSNYREAFDVATARALAPMRVLVELCLPFVRVGGRLLAQKTTGEDVEGARHAIDLLGGSLQSVVTAPSAVRDSGTVIIVGKIAATPQAYPRRAGVPNRKPL